VLLVHFKHFANSGADQASASHSLILQWLLYEPPPHASWLSLDQSSAHQPYLADMLRSIQSLTWPREWLPLNIQYLRLKPPPSPNLPLRQKRRSRHSTSTAGRQMSLHRSQRCRHTPSTSTRLGLWCWTP